MLLISSMKAFIAPSSLAAGDGGLWNLAAHPWTLIVMTHDWCFEILHGRLLTFVHENRDLCCGDHDDHGISLEEFLCILQCQFFPLLFFFFRSLMSHLPQFPLLDFFPLSLLHDFPCLMKIRFLPFLCLMKIRSLPCLCLFHQLLLYQHPQLPLLEDSNLVRKRRWVRLDESYFALPLQKHMMLSSSSTALLLQQRAQHGTSHHYCGQSTHVWSEHPCTICVTPPCPLLNRKKNSNKKNLPDWKNEKKKKKIWDGPVLRSPDADVCWPVDNPNDFLNGNLLYRTNSHRKENIFFPFFYFLKKYSFFGMLIIKLVFRLQYNQTFASLIIKSFDNQTGLILIIKSTYQ